MRFSTIAFTLFGATVSASAFSLVARQDLPGTSVIVVFSTNCRSNIL